MACGRAQPAAPLALAAPPLRRQAPPPAKTIRGFPGEGCAISIPRHVLRVVGATGCPPVRALGEAEAEPRRLALPCPHRAQRQAGSGL